MSKVIACEINDETRDPLLRIALSMYLGEVCPYCKKTFSRIADLNDAVYNGYTEYGRIAHADCWKRANSSGEATDGDTNAEP